MRPRRKVTAIFACEQEIMDLWDAGESVESIAEQLGKERTYVSAIVGRLHVTSFNPEHQMIRQGTAALLAAIKRHHPEMVR